MQASDTLQVVSHKTNIGTHYITKYMDPLALYTHLKINW